MIVNAHEHLESAAEWETYRGIMQSTGLNHALFVGSGDVTVYNKGGFRHYKERNTDILTIAKPYSGEVSIFPCLNPLDEDKVECLERYLKAGARGIKLYYGLGSIHDEGPWHTVPLDYEGMRPIFERCLELDLPIIFHVNRVPFMEEQLNFLTKYPGIKVCFPHLMVSTASPHRMRVNAAIMDRFPNIFLDISMGREVYLLAFAESISLRPDIFRDFLIKYAGRVMWGTDLVITKNKMTNMVGYVEQMIGWYRDIVEKQDYMTPEFIGGKEMKGIGLSGSALTNIYSGAFMRFIGSKVYQPSAQPALAPAATDELIKVM